MKKTISIILSLETKTNMLTPFEQEEKIIRERQQSAVEAIEKDPNVNSIKDKFSGVVENISAK